jgi:hypothetical protein
MVMKGLDYEPTGLAPSTLEIIAMGGDLVGAASIFLNPPLRAIGNAITNYRVAADEKPKDYFKEAKSAAKEAREKAEKDEFEESEFKRNRDFEDNLRQYQIAGLDMDLRLKDKGLTPNVLDDILRQYQIAGLDMDLRLKEKELRSRKKKNDGVVNNIYGGRVEITDSLNPQATNNNNTKTYGLKNCLGSGYHFLGSEYNPNSSLLMPSASVIAQEKIKNGKKC